MRKMLSVFLFCLVMMLVASASAQTPLGKPKAIEKVKPQTKEIKQLNLAHVKIVDAFMQHGVNGQMSIRVTFKNLGNIHSEEMLIQIQRFDPAQNTWANDNKETLKALAPGEESQFFQARPGIQVNPYRVMLMGKGGGKVYQTVELDPLTAAPRPVLLTALPCSNGQTYELTVDNDQTIRERCTIRLSGRANAGAQWTPLGSVQDVTIPTGVERLNLGCLPGSTYDQIRVEIDGRFDPMKDVTFQKNGQVWMLAH